MPPSLNQSQVIGVVGSGAMGAGIAQIAAAAGHVVVLHDTRPEALDKAITAITQNYARLVSKGKMSTDDAQRAGQRLRGAQSLGDLAGCDMVVEAIAENLEAKQALFAALESIVAPDCILATNTSSISVTAIAAKLQSASRLVGMHFFNPVPLMALVEVVSGLATSREVADTVYATAAAWGKKPVHTRSTPGFIVNRVARPYYAEALRLLNEQAGDVPTLDALMREAGGFRMGPFELMDLIGHDVNFAVTQSVFQAFFCDPRFTPSLIQRELVDAGFLGRKSGRGFYSYDDAAVAEQARVEPAMQAPHSMKLGAATGVTSSLLARIEKTGIPVTTGIFAPAGDALVGLDNACLYLTDGRSATQRAACSGYRNTVLIDLALDYASSGKVAVTKADQCDEAGYAAVVGLLQAAGFTVSRLNDVPGMAVMRTVAMLANEAADAVNQGVCSVEAVDLAMEKGVNYPRGPLAWADAVGAGYIVDVLRHLAQGYGEDRYRVSPMLQRRADSGEKIYA